MKSFNEWMEKNHHNPYEMGSKLRYELSELKRIFNSVFPDRTTYDGKPIKNPSSSELHMAFMDGERIFGNIDHYLTQAFGKNTRPE